MTDLHRRLKRLEALKEPDTDDGPPLTPEEAFKQALAGYYGELSGTPEEAEALRQSVPVFEAAIAEGRTPEEA